MSEFVRLTEQAFSDYHGKQVEGNWDLSDAMSHLASWLSWHGRLDNMSGLPDAVAAMTADEITAFRRRFPSLTSVCNALEIK